MAEITVPFGDTCCRACLRTLTRRLRDVAGVQTVVLDGAGRIHLTGTMAEREVRRAVEDAGIRCPGPAGSAG